MNTKDSLWYKDAIIYETHVRAFFDSNDNGVGDFPGLTKKLDYLQDLGINCLWLLPFYPSPLKDDGYDISSYKGINPLYGTMREFRHFVREAHKRGIYVMTELVINHTSDQHPWFQRARKSPPNSIRKNFYVWSDTDQKYNMARIIFTDSEKSNWSWDPLAKAHYWHRFFHHQPDLNYDNPAVLREVIKLLRFWLDMGVDGLRLDAVPYLLEREGTNCENLPETHLILKEIRRQVDLHYSAKTLLAEANQWPTDVLPYFGNGDECHMAYHFPLMPRIFMALRQEDRHPITDIMRQTPEIPDVCQWALFLRNHDELTLEMVTDEERDYMYKVYAADPRMRINIGIRRRLAPLVDNGRRRIELMNSLLFSFQGTPIIYYGDEIGMGDNIYLGDRNGVRTPMQWSSDRNAGFSRADFARLYAAPIMDPVYGYQAINVEAQQRDPSSLLNWMKRLISLRKKHKTFGRGTIEFLSPKNRKVLVYVRKYEEEVILCAANLSRFVQPVELDLSHYKGLTPVEMLGKTEFPPIGDLPYFLTMAPHSFYWFLLQRVPETINIRVVPSLQEEAEPLPVLEISAPWQKLLEKELEQPPGDLILPPFLRKQRWFAGKSQQIKSVRVVDRIYVETRRPFSVILLVQIEFEGDYQSQLYTVPLTIYTKVEALPNLKQNVVALAKSRDGDGLLMDAMADPVFCESLFWAFGDYLEIRGRNGVLRIIPTDQYFDVRKRVGTPVKVQRNLGEQSNTSIIYGDALILKLIRRVEYGPNPEHEILRFLTEQAKFEKAPQLAGVIEYELSDGKIITLAVLETLVANQGGAWNHTLEELGRFFERASSWRYGFPQSEENQLSFFDLLNYVPPPVVSETVGIYLEEALTLGRRTAELHLALATPTDDLAFTPEDFTEEEFQQLSNSFREHARKVYDILEQSQKTLPEQIGEKFQNIIASFPSIQSLLEKVASRNTDVVKIRVHGDYHLGQLLWVKNDFVIIDFEGEPARSIEERRKKQSPLKDLAGMIRSFSYAAHAALNSFAQNRPEGRNQLAPWALMWEKWVSAAFLKGYLELVRGARFVPTDPVEFNTLLSAFLLDKALYELNYELSHRPDWVRIPVAGIELLLESTNQIMTKE